MNFLSLCKRLRQEAGYSGSGPASVTGQAGEAKRIVDWINDSWVDLQKVRADWRFMLSQFDVSLAAGDSTVAFPSDFKSFRSDVKVGFVLYREDGGRTYPTVLQPEDMRKLILENEDRPGYPFYVSVDNGVMTVFPSCNESIRIKGDYYVKPSSLSENTDIPRLPEEFHMAIVWQALMAVGAYDEAANTWQRGSDKFMSVLNELNSDQLPTPKVGGPIA